MIFKGDVTEVIVGDPPYNLEITVDKAPEAFAGKCDVGPVRLTMKEKIERKKTDGQVAHETFHAELAKAGVNSRGGWEPLDPRRKVAWETAAASIVGRTLDTVRPLIGVKPSDWKLAFPHGESKKVAFDLKTLTRGHSFTFPPLRPEQRDAVEEALKRGGYYASVPVRHGMCSPASWRFGFTVPLNREPPREWLDARKKFGTLVHKAIEESFTKMDDKNDQIRALNDEIERLLEKNNEAAEEVSDTRIDRDEARNRADRLEKELAAVKNERDAERRRASAAELRADALRKNLDAEEKRADNLKREFLQATKERDVALAETSRAKAETKRLQDELNTTLLVVDQLVREKIGAGGIKRFELMRRESTFNGRDVVTSLDFLDRGNPIDGFKVDLRLDAVNRVPQPICLSGERRFNPFRY